MRTLLIDHYDSFTYNLFHLLAIVNGEEPVVVQHDIAWKSLCKLHRQQDFDNLVLSPGPGHPARAADCGISYQAMQALQVPVLGVCLGLQIMGYHFGACIVQASEPYHGRSSVMVQKVRDVLFTQIPQQFTAVRYHSLNLAYPLPDVLTELAYTKQTSGADDSPTIPMAIRHKILPIWGVQFHPESILSQHGHQLFYSQAQQF